MNETEETKETCCTECCSLCIRLPARREWNRHVEISGQLSESPEIQVA